MRKSGIVLMLGVSLMMALGATLLARSWMAERTAGDGDGSDETSVVVAAMEIPYGRTVQAAELRLMQLPPEAIPEGSFNHLEDVVGRVTSQTIYQGEVVLERRVAEHLGGSALAAVLEHGKRAMTVRVDDVVGVAGFLLPGNRVDVLSTQRRGGTREVESETILTNIKVLAVDQTASPERDAPVIVRAVTLEVEPPQAERLVKATQEGKVQLTLRNPLDAGESANGEVAEPEPKPEPEPEPQPAARPEPVRARPAPPPRPRIVNVTVIRGTDSSTTNVRE
ncbi:Flp pilus assembly protein CpaB [Aquisalimonas sp.]|uniref:Flp pilus assembly protein CpaB n=1 Tax=Aquisalimonas sp. TaxID=1872621 RepID=UPI0025C271FE|nr:Flp pilus assembly protein CpaB [Aquisalimonas sp.]